MPDCLWKMHQLTNLASPEIHKMPIKDYKLVIKDTLMVRILIYCQVTHHLNHRIVICRKSVGSLEEAKVLLLTASSWWGYATVLHITFKPAKFYSSYNYKLDHIIKNLNSVKDENRLDCVTCGCSLQKIQSLLHLRMQDPLELHKLETFWN